MSRAGTKLNLIQIYYKLSQVLLQNDRPVDTINSLRNAASRQLAVCDGDALTPHFNLRFSRGSRSTLMKSEPLYRGGARL